MRSLLSRLVAGSLFITGSAVTAQADAGALDRLDVYGVELPADTVVPTAGLGIPSAVVPHVGNRNPAAPVPQAIPTPTAFHAGVGLLAALFVCRRFGRKTLLKR